MTTTHDEGARTLTALAMGGAGVLLAAAKARAAAAASTPTTPAGQANSALVPAAESTAAARGPGANGSAEPASQDEVDADGNRIPPPLKQKNTLLSMFGCPKPKAKAKTVAKEANVESTAPMADETTEAAAPNGHATVAPTEAKPVDQGVKALITQNHDMRSFLVRGKSKGKRERNEAEPAVTDTGSSPKKQKG